eukprot:g21972.t1
MKGVLNKRARRLTRRAAKSADELRIEAQNLTGGGRILDFGVEAAGGLAAGLMLAEICMSGLGRAQLVEGRVGDSAWPSVSVRADHPVAACLLSQYAGWQISVDKYFAMGSGPMRAAAAREELFEKLDYRELPKRVVGTLETSTLPDAAVFASIAEKARVPVERVELVCAPVSSQAGNIQVVARSVETALHKLFELGFDVNRIQSGFGTAPLPPVAKDDLTGIGRTNDAILYGGSVTLWCVRLDFERLNSRIDAASGEQIHCGETVVSDFDVIIVRTMPPGSLEQVVFRMDLLGRCEAAGVIVLNSAKSLECAVDKYLTTSKLIAAGLRVPETICCEDSVTAMDAFATLGGDVVVKPLFGAEGRGICRVSDPDLALRTFRTLERIQSVLYLQRYIDHDGSDIRLLMFDGDCIGAMCRRSADFRVNISRSGRGEPHHPDDREVHIARQAMQATGARFGGVDILYDRAGEPHVLEINAVPGWRALTRVTGIDIAQIVIHRLAREVPPASLPQEM